MCISKKDYYIIKEKDKGEVICLNFEVIKYKQNDNYTVYEGIKKKERFYEIKNNQNGYNGKWFKFSLTNGKIDYVKGPWYDFSYNWH